MEGAIGRLRPILMTSCAMAAGMTSRHLAGAKGASSRPRWAVRSSAGLAAATFATLFVLPTVFAIVQGGAGRHSASLDPFDAESAHFVPGAAESANHSGVEANGTIADVHDGFPVSPSFRGEG